MACVCDFRVKSCISFRTTFPSGPNTAIDDMSSSKSLLDNFKIYNISPKSSISTNQSVYTLSNTSYTTCMQRAKGQSQDNPPSKNPGLHPPLFEGKLCTIYRTLCIRSDSRFQTKISPELDHFLKIQDQI